MSSFNANVFISVRYCSIERTSYQTDVRIARCLCIFKKKSVAFSNSKTIVTNNKIHFFEKEGKYKLNRMPTFPFIC